MNQEQFVEVVWDYYHDHGRSLPWREPEPDGSFDPYKIMVSEVMLQQTQVARVTPKYLQFLELFPSVQSLADAPLAAVLTAWSGLGYNRRAKFLWQAAQTIVSDYNGQVPHDQASLTALPGIGVNTAGAIAAYTYNQPVAFVETNIRSVFIYHFFSGQDKVDDKQILELVTRTLPPDAAEIRSWYWALMDYGVFLKATVGNTARSSKHYVKQSGFHGSKRQIRGQIIRLLTQKAHTTAELKAVIDDERLLEVLEDLKAEQLISTQNGCYTL